MPFAVLASYAYEQAAGKPSYVNIQVWSCVADCFR